MAAHDIAIVGAGMAGLTAALTLQRFGYEPVVLEQSDALAEVGAGLSMSPNAMHIMDFLGLGDTVRKHATPLAGGQVRHYQTNEPLVPTATGTPEELQAKYGNGYYQIHRADLHGILTDAVRTNDANCLKLGCEFEAFEQEDGQVTAYFRDGTQTTSAALIGCDGGKSLVRESGFSQERPTFAGCVAYRGLVPMELLEGDSFASARLSIGPGQMFLHYPVRHGTLLNFVGIVVTSDWKLEGWNIPFDTEEVLDHFGEWHADVKQVINATPDGAGFKWAIIHRSPLARFADGRVALLGDAAHTITPFLGQGAAMAMEDGVILGRCFDATSTVEEALSLYEALRLPRGNWVMRESQEEGKRLMSNEPRAFDPAQSARVHQKLYGYNAPIVTLDPETAQQHAL